MRKPMCLCFSYVFQNKSFNHLKVRALVSFKCPVSIILLRRIRVYYFCKFTKLVILLSARQKKSVFIRYFRVIRVPVFVDTRSVE